jgi:ion channel POLLUX/CASTOR
VPLDFYTLIESAALKGETAIGYRLASLSRSSDAAYGIHLNPKKTDSITFAPGDKVIVLAED